MDHPRPKSDSVSKATRSVHKVGYQQMHLGTFMVRGLKQVIAYAAKERHIGGGAARIRYLDLLTIQLLQLQTY